MTSFGEVLDKTRVFFNRLLEVALRCHTCCNSECFTRTVNVLSDHQAPTTEDVIELLDILEHYHVKESTYEPPTEEPTIS